MSANGDVSKGTIIAVIMFFIIFLFSIYSLFIIASDLRPYFFGNKVKAAVIEVDSIESYKKNKFYTYFGKLKFQDGDKSRILKYDFNHKKKVDDQLNLYYHGEYGLYDENNNNLYFILCGILFISFIATGAFLRHYLKLLM